MERLQTAPSPGHVLVIGGGIGGLALAQGLRKQGIQVSVFERDRTPTDRLQGYRVHISPGGSAALHACLPPELFATFERTCGRVSSKMRFLTERMGRVLTVDFRDMPVAESLDPVAQHRSVSRVMLREVLLSGLQGDVHFGKTFTHYEECDGRMVAHFEDGSWVQGDLLVAADGGGSRVRKQFLPQAQRIDTGVVGIAGKVFLDDATRQALAPEFIDGLTLVSARNGCGLFCAVQDLSGAQTSIAGADDAAVAADVHLDSTRSYVMWALSARRAAFGIGDGGSTLGSEALRSIALRAMDGWDDRFRDLVRLSDDGTINLLDIRTSLPVKAWQPQRVTLIGDAIHAMTPFRGIGANIALKDAARLCDALAAVQRGEKPLLEAIAGYEQAMREYGFRAVRTSLHAMKQTVGQGALAHFVSRILLRLIDAMPPAKRMMLSAMTRE